MRRYYSGDPVRLAGSLYNMYDPRNGTTPHFPAARRFRSRSAITHLPRLTSARGIGSDQSALLDVRLQEPQRLVEVARGRGEDVGGVGIAGLVGLVDRLRARRWRPGIAVDQRMQMVVDRVDVGRVGRQLALPSPRPGVVPSAVPPSWTPARRWCRRDSSSWVRNPSSISWMAMNAGPSGSNAPAW